MRQPSIQTLADLIGEENGRYIRKGTRVCYSPFPGADSDTHEFGVISSVSPDGVYVKYDNHTGQMLTGDEDVTAQLTSLEHLTLA